MPALQRTMAKLHPLVKDLPEFVHILAGGKADVHEVDRDDPLVKAAVVFRLAVFIDIGRQKAAAPHAGIALPIAVLVYLELLHDLFGNIIRYHALGRAPGRQLC